MTWSRPSRPEYWEGTAGTAVSIDVEYRNCGSGNTSALLANGGVASEKILAR